VTDSGLGRFYSGKRVLVTGGAGFVGSHVVESLVEFGARVRVPLRESTRKDYLRAVENDVEFVEANLFVPEQAAATVEGQEVILHLAAAKGGGIEHSMRHHGSLFRDNLLVAINMIDAARHVPDARFVSVSSACVYPRHVTIPTPEDEGFKDAPEPTNAGYGWSKRMQEYLTTSFADEFGIDVGIVRPFNTYGPRDDFFKESNHVIPGLVRRVVGGESPLVVWGSGRQTRSFLYVKDCAHGILLAGARSGVRGPINLGGAEETSIADLARMIVRTVGVDIDVQFDHDRPDGQPRRACDVRLAKRELGFEAATPLEEGLRSAVDWYRTEKRAWETVT
jgi:GDP-L-fucose synthase